MSLFVDIGFKPQPGPQAAFVNSVADITIYGGARGGGKTYAALGDFWLHAEEFGPHARGLMIRKRRTELRDTIVVAQQLYGSAATWKEHGSYFQFANGARLDMAYLESEADAMSFQGWSLTRVYVEELTQLSSPDPGDGFVGHAPICPRRSLPAEGDLQSRRSRPPLGEGVGDRWWSVQDNYRSRNRSQPGLRPSPRW